MIAVSVPAGSAPRRRRTGPASETSPPPSSSPNPQRKPKTPSSRSQAPQDTAQASARTTKKSNLHSPARSPSPAPKSRPARQTPSKPGLSLWASTRPIRRLVASVLWSILWPLLPYGLLALVAWVALVAARSFVLSHLAAIPLALQAPLARALAALPSPRLLLPAPHRVVSLVALPASFFSALKGSKSSSTELLSVSMMAAHSAHERAHHALDVFDNLLRLSSPDGPSSVALEPVAIWELSAAVKYSSALEDRDFLAEQLGELGDLSRTVKDDITSLNAQGINAFTFIVNDFSRLETLLSSFSDSNKRVSAKERQDFEHLLETLFDRISDSLSALLVSLDHAIPSATRASDAAHQLFRAFKRENAERVEQWDETTWPARLLDAAGVGSKKARLLRQDIDLTETSALAVRNVWIGLDRTRTALKSYQANVGYYKASIIGSHLAAGSLSLEHEVQGLKGVMGQIRHALQEAKQMGRSQFAGQPGDQPAASRRPTGLPDVSSRA